MLFLLGLLGLIQLVLLPGILLLRMARIQPRSISEGLVNVFSVSLVLNHLLSWLLVTVHAHSRMAWLVVLLVEVFFIAILTRRDRTEAPPVGSSLAAGPPRLAAALAVVSVLSFVPLLYENWATVYTANDDVASWDRWARDWFANRPPEGAKLYPQLLPANWSITYALLSTDQVKMFGKAIMPLFPLGIVMTFLALYRRRGDRGYWIGAFLAALLLFVYLGAPFLISGYADVPSAFFAFLAFATLHARDEHEPHSAAFALLHGAGAALTKQGGIFVFAVIVVWAVIVMRRSKRMPNVSLSAGIAALGAIIGVAAWYGLQIYATAQGVESSNLRFLTLDIHEGRGFLERLSYARGLLISRGGEFGGLIFWGSAALLAVSLGFRRTRLLAAGFVVPGYLLWAGLFSYEMRTGAILFPFAALAMGLAASAIMGWVVSRAAVRWKLPERWRPIAIASFLVITARLLHFFGQGTAVLNAAFFWPLLAVAAYYVFRFAVSPIPNLPLLRVNGFALSVSLFVLAAAGGTARYPNAELLRQQIRAQRAIGKPAVNARLYELFESGRLNHPVINNYWYFQSLPDIGPINRLITCGGNCTIENVLRDVVLTPEAHFLLVEDLFLPPATVRTLGFCRGLEALFAEGTVRLFRIHRERFDGQASSCTADPEMRRPVIVRTYPQSTTAGTGFNLQPDGLSALGVECRNASQSSVIFWDEIPLSSAFAGAEAVTGLVPPKLYAKPGNYKVEVLDRDTGLRSQPFTFEVK